MSEVDIYTRFRAQGLSEAGTIGAMANADAESNLCSFRQQGDFSPNYAVSRRFTEEADRGERDDSMKLKSGYGLFMWGGDRRYGLLLFARERGVSVGDEALAVDYCMKELHTSEYTSLLHTLQTTDSIEEATVDFLNIFERPNDPDPNNRISKARDLYKRLHSLEENSKMCKQNVIDIALSEVGYQEGTGNINKFAEYLDGISNFYNGRKNGYAWCDVFVDYCFVKAYGRTIAQRLLCQPDNSLGAGCTFSARYYQRAGRWSNTPQIGAQVFFGNATESYHTGLVYDFDDSYIYTVEGNTSDMVAKRQYSLHYENIYGYGLPDYSMLDNPSTGMDYSGTYGDDDNDEVVYATESASTSAKPHCSVLLPELSLKCHGAAVVSMQTLLIAKHFSVGGEGADGDFGAATLQGVINFQTENGLDADGVCGANTWAQLIGA